MNKVFDQPFSPKGDTAEPPLSQSEVAQLRAILQVVSYDAASQTLRIEHGPSKILVRKNGTVRIEGKKLASYSQGSIVLNGASIELN